MPFPAPRYGATGPADPPDPRHPCPDCGEERAETHRGYVCTDCTPPICPDCRTPTHWRPMTFRPDLLTPADCGDCPEPE
jgi:hypothetical protein